MGMTLAELPRMGDLLLQGMAELAVRAPSWRRGLCVSWKTWEAFEKERREQPGPLPGSKGSVAAA